MGSSWEGSAREASTTFVGKDVGRLKNVNSKSSQPLFSRQNLNYSTSLFQTETKSSEHVRAACGNYDDHLPTTYIGCKLVISNVDKLYYPCMNCT